MGKRMTVLLCAVCIGLGALIGSLTGSGPERLALAAPGPDGSAGPVTVYKGPFRNVNYRVQGLELQKALHVNEIVLFKDLLVFKENDICTQAVSVYSLQNLNVTLAP